MRRNDLSRACWAVLFFALLLSHAGGVAGDEADEFDPEAFIASKPYELQWYYRKVVESDPNDFVLANLELGMAGMRLGYAEESRAAFDRALSGIETVYADNEEAEKARSLWAAERTKDFKGEPYERSMAYLYRGLLYLEDDDYENARASFKAGSLQDTIAEKEEFQADFALLDYLESWASHCNGDVELADEAFARAASLRSGIVPPAPEDRVLAVFELGSSPQKFNDGEYGQYLRFRRGDALVEELETIEVSNSAVSPAVSEDVYFQASTRGGREIEAVLEGQAVTKELTHDSANLLLVAGQAFVQNAEGEAALPMLAIGGGLMATGLIVHGIGSLMNPAADSRYWASLPDRIEVATLATDPDASGLRLSARIAGQGHLEPVHATFDRGDLADSGCDVVWLRSPQREARVLGRRFAGRTYEFDGAKEGRRYAVAFGDPPVVPPPAPAVEEEIGVGIAADGVVDDEALPDVASGPPGYGFATDEPGQ